MKLPIWAWVEVIIADEVPAAPFRRPFVFAEIFAVATIVAAAVSADATVDVAAAGAVEAWVRGSSGSGGCPAFLRILLIDDTDGIEFGSQTLWARS